MIRLLLVLGALAISVRCAPNTAANGDLKVWNELREFLPVEYVEYAEKQGLSQSRSFQNDLIRKLYEQAARNSDMIEARQKILVDYVGCSCGTCANQENKVVQKGNERQLIWPFVNPLTVVSNLLTSCETDLVLQTVKILRNNVENLQAYNLKLIAHASCNCPDTETCRNILDPLIFTIVTGGNETVINKIYWQSKLPEFPKIVERGIFDTMTNAISSIMTTLYQWNRPKQPVVQQPLQSPPANTFAPEANTQNSQAPEKACPNVQVNITNNPSGNSNQTSSLKPQDKSNAEP